MLAAITCLAASITPATAQPDASPPVAAAESVRSEQMTEFRRLIAERDRDIQRLHELDRAAAEAIRRGGEPVSLYAEQMALQDRLDLIALRIDLLASRLGIDVPPPPHPRGDVSGQADGPGGMHDEQLLLARAHRQFERGRDRALRLIRADARRFLASLDLSAFLNTDPQGRAAAARPPREATDSSATR